MPIRLCVQHQPNLDNLGCDCSRFAVVVMVLGRKIDSKFLKLELKLRNGYIRPLDDTTVKYEPTLPHGGKVRYPLRFRLKSFSTAHSCPLTPSASYSAAKLLREHTPPFMFQRKF